MQLDGATTIVTGAGSGIGRALALEFARHGSRVVCAGRREDRLRATVESIEADGGQALAVPTDVTDAAQTKRLAAQAIDHFGSIDVLFNNAGSFQALGPIWQVDPDAWWRDVTVNLRGPMLCARAVLAYMLQADRGIIINMNGGNQIPGGTGYSCSKVALQRFTELLAKELQRQGSNVMVFGMGPGLVRTEMTELQAQTEAGRYWIPSTAESFEQGHTRPPELCAQKTIELIQIARPALSGQSFGVGTDFQQVLAEL